MFLTKKVKFNNVIVRGEATKTAVAIYAITDDTIELSLVKLVDDASPLQIGGDQNTTRMVTKPKWWIWCWHG